MNEALALREDAPQPVADSGFAALARFRLRAPTRALDAEGCLARLPPGPAATLGARADGFFARPVDGPALLVGALPFDPHQDDALFQPARLGAAVTASAPLPALAGEAVPEPGAQAYLDAVARCVARLQDAGEDVGALRKVVLARSLRIDAAAAIDPFALAERLGADPSISAFVAPLPVAAGAAPAWLVGATPELLVSRRGTAVVSHPLAGSARRLRDPGADTRAAEALLASRKDHDEHRHVVEAILDGLAPLCSRLRAPATPSLHATATMWHLGTRIEGVLKDPSISAATLAGVLHPTPAVCGTPRAPALAAIRALEPVDRGFYAGAVGWVDAAGDGDWYVSIRCAHVQDRAMRLFAGAGIVAGSQPALELDETAAKFRALLDALGIGDVRTARHA